MSDIIITMKNGDVMKAELYPEIAPVTVANFLELIQKKFFDGLIFHRVIEDFMIQGGGYDEKGNHKDTPSIKGEFTRNGFTNNLKHTRGVLSMARTSFPNSASSQFFIMHKDSPHLDGQYAAFGKITEGIEVVDKIAGVKTDYQDCPVEPQVIESIRLA
jgi:peptidyl-prolyl cis-trans isomerase B (cyclophilin B)